MSKQTGPILLATDLSAGRPRAGPGAAVGQERGTQLIVLHVMESHGGTARLTTPSGGACRPITRRWPNANWPRTWRFGRLHRSGVSGDPLARILETADAYGCSLIVTGTARDETLGRLLLGTRRQPVLVVKNRPRRPYRDVLVATDFGSRRAAPRCTWCPRRT